MNSSKHILKVATFLIVAVMASLFLIEAQRTYSFNKTVEQIPPVTISVTPSPTGTIMHSEMISPEGSKLLELEVTKNSDEVVNAITISDTDTESTEIVTLNPTVNEEFQIPFNTWSPNLFYFFMKTDTEYYVFQSSGELFPSGEQYVTVNSLFEENAGNYTIDEVTGWADNTLLVVNTHSDSGEKVSFWFDVPSRSFIQLGNYYE